MHTQHAACSVFKLLLWIMAKQESRFVRWYNIWALNFRPIHFSVYILYIVRSRVSVESIIIVNTMIFIVFAFNLKIKLLLFCIFLIVNTFHEKTKITFRFCKTANCFFFSKVYSNRIKCCILYKTYLLGIIFNRRLIHTFGTLVSSDYVQKQHFKNSVQILQFL